METRPGKSPSFLKKLFGNVPKPKKAEPLEIIPIIGLWSTQNDSSPYSVIESNLTARTPTQQESMHEKLGVKNYGKDILS